MRIREGTIVEVCGSQYYVLEVSGGACSQSMSGEVLFYSPPNTVILKRIVSNEQQ